MKFGVFDHVDRSGAPLGEQLEKRLALAAVYDRVGMHGYHVAEHHGTPLGYAPSPSVYLSAVIQRTTRMRVGPLVYLLPLYHPIRLIEEICMLDQMSNGRLMLGVGRGVSPIELGFYGQDAEQAQGKYIESLDCILNGLTHETLDHHGHYYHFNEVPMTMRPLQKPHPELWYGAINPESAVWAAQNNVNLVTIALADGTRALTDRYRQEWAALGKAADEIPLIGVSRHVVVADTDRQAKGIAARAYTKWRESFCKLWVDAGIDVPMVSAIYPESWDDLEAIGNGFAGSPESTKAYVQTESEKGGVNYFVGWFAFGDMTLEESTHSAELFAESVMPAFS